MIKLTSTLVVRVSTFTFCFLSSALLSLFLPSFFGGHLLGFISAEKVSGESFYNRRIRLKEVQAGSSGTRFSLEFFDQLCIAFRVFLRFP